MEHWVYMVECGDGSFYIGYAKDVERRVFEHNNSAKAAKYTRSRRPVKLVYKQHALTRSEALRLEHQLKKLSREKKSDLISHSL